MVEEVEKVQLTGRSTFIVSLPKKWVVSMGLRAGDQLVIVQEGPSLVITPRAWLDRELALAKQPSGSQRMMLLERSRGQ
jgi:phosphate uptake regulator